MALTPAHRRRLDTAGHAFRAAAAERTAAALEASANGASVREIAEALGSSKSAVDRLIRRAAGTDGTDGTGRSQPRTADGTARSIPVPPT